MTNEELVVRIKAGIDVSDNMLELYNQVRGFIYSIAKNYRTYGELEDLQQEGYLALYDAIDGFEPDKGNKFLTYASWHIKQRIRRYIVNQGSCLRFPEKKKDLLRQYSKLCNQYMVMHGREPTESETANSLNLSLEQSRDLINLSGMSKLGSLDTPLKAANGGEGIILEDLVADPVIPEEEIVDRLEYEQLKNELWDCVDSLEGDQPGIIRKRYMDDMTLQAIADDCGTTKEAIRQDVAKGLRELRKPRYSRRLIPYMEDIRSSAMYGVGVEHFQRTWTSSTEYTVFRLLEGRIR